MNYILTITTLALIGVSLSANAQDRRGQRARLQAPAPVQWQAQQWRHPAPVYQQQHWQRPVPQHHYPPHHHYPRPRYPRHPAPMPLPLPPPIEQQVIIQPEYHVEQTCGEVVACVEQVPCYEQAYECPPLIPDTIPEQSYYCPSAYCQQAPPVLPYPGFQVRPVPVPGGNFGIGAQCTIRQVGHGFAELIQNNSRLLYRGTLPNVYAMLNYYRSLNTLADKIC